MKVFQVVPRLQSGGVERGTLEIAGALVRQGHASVVVSEGGRWVEHLVANGSRHIQMQVGAKRVGTLASVRKLRACVEREEPNVVHARSRLPAWLCRAALRGRGMSGTAFATSVHGLYSVSRYSAIMGEGDLVEVVSDTARDYLVANYPAVDPSRIRTIYRGIEPNLFRPKFRPSAAWQENWNETLAERGCTTIVLPGRLARLKGHLEFLEVCRELERIGFPYRGLIVGGIEPGRDSYARKLGRAIEADPDLRSHVTLLGHRDDLREIMSSADIVVSLSTKPEAFGRTVLEALSLGTPVVGFDHGGVGEILRKLFPNGAVPPFDCSRTAQAICRLTRDPQPILPHNYTLESMCLRTIAMYLELAS